MISRRRWWTSIAAGALAVVAGGCATNGDDLDEAITPAAGEPVTIPADGIELAGTLRLPASDPPYAAVTIAHGSGPQSREGLAPGQLGLTLPSPVPVHGELADGLIEAGYAVLTWDKRSCGPFNDCADNDYPQPPEDLTLDTLRDDVATVLDHLGDREDVDELVLVGHSKGGTLTAELAASRDDLAAVVLLAASPLPIDEVLATQADTLEELVAAVGQDDGQAEFAVAEVRQLAADVTAVGDGEVDGPPIGGAGREFWASWLQASAQAPEWLEAAEVPALVLGGEQDWNVPPEQVRAWEPALSGADRLEILDEITHALTRLEGEDPASITGDQLGTEVDESVIATITDWLDEVLQH